MQHSEYARAVGGEGVRFEGSAYVFARVQRHPQPLERPRLVPARQVLVALEGVLGNAALPVVRVLHSSLAQMVMAYIDLVGSPIFPHAESFWCVAILRSKTGPSTPFP